jgi:hypothetical protein
MKQGDKIVEFLRCGVEATSAELKSRFGIANPRAAVDSVRDGLRLGGLDIYSNSRTNKKGVTTRKYRIGAITKAVHYGRDAMGWFTSDTYKSFARAGLV